MLVREHKAVCHSTCVYGIMKLCSVNCANPAARVARHARTDHRLAMEIALGRSAGVLLLRLFKGRRLITLSMGPHRKDDPDPHIRKRPYGDGVTFALRSFALIVVLSPRLTLGGLPRKLMQGVAQRFDAAQPAMGFGVHPALKQHRRRSTQSLQAACVLVSLSIITDFCQQPRSQA